MVPLLDIAVSRNDADDVVVELMFADRRIGFVYDVHGERVSWFIASLPPHARDGSGTLNTFVTARMIISRGLTS